MSKQVFTEGGGKKMLLLEQTIAQIQPLDEEAMAAARKRLDSLTKPLGSLGRLEKLAVQAAGIYKKALPEIKKKAVVVMAGDHGVVEEGVSAFPQEVTTQMLLNFCNGGAAINVLGRHAGAEIILVDVGVATPLTDPRVLQYNIRKSTANFTKGPAMAVEEAVKALETGIIIAGELFDQGFNLLATGEMGIGNTTPSSALLAVFSGLPAEELSGLGTGVDKAGLARKVTAIRKGLAVNSPNPDKPLDALAKIGGLEIAALSGLILGAASRRIPVVVDGFISGVAALVSSRFKPGVVDYLIPSHQSAEPGHKILLDLLGLDSIFKMDMRLGEGTGAALGMHVLEGACKIMAEMATFAEAGVSQS